MFCDDKHFHVCLYDAMLDTQFPVPTEKEYKFCLQV
jgi:hypothetical protein